MIVDARACMDGEVAHDPAHLRVDALDIGLRELVEVLNKVEPRFGSELMAYAWYRSEPLPGFDGRTAMQLVQEGKAQQVLEYIDAVDAGVFA